VPSSSSGPKRCTRAIWTACSPFEIVSLDVTAGDDVAFAYALLRCGTAEEHERDPDNRLRLSLGLRKENGRWLVSHEHHSFPLP
jgi:ketosteroid isomerase-like protein